MRKHWYLVAYDISHPRRLSRVHKTLTAHGYALQNSIFLCQGTRNELKQLYKLLCSQLQAKEDDLRMFPLSTSWYLQFWGINPLDLDLHDSQWPTYQILTSETWGGRVSSVETPFTLPPLRYA